MKQAWMAVLTAAAMALGGTAATLVSTDAEAKRLGSGRSQGMQRTMPPPAAPAKAPTTATPTPGAPAAAAAPAAAGAAAAAGKRSWMGPIAGLAAGLGLAALMSHLGMGEQFANFLMLALLAVAAIFLVRFLLARFAASKQGGLGAGGLRPATATAGAGAGAGASAWNNQPAMPAQSPTMQRNAFAATSGELGTSPDGTAGSVPADFDSAGFERIAKMIFIRMQTANDSADLNDLRNFTTPEMFAAVRLELQERGDAPQNTDVLKVDAEVLDVAEEADRQVVSVRFHGLVREERESVATDFDEVWHLVKPNDDSRPWAIAGIQQR
jgi:predicted lipid-binding transport protein (Tim44 family)